MRKLLVLILASLLISATAFADDQRLSSVANEVKRLNDSVTIFFYELNREAITIRPPVFETDAPVLVENLEKYEKTLTLMKKLKDFSTSYGQMLVDMVEGEEVLTGEQLHVLAKGVSAYHHLSAKVLEFSSVYNLTNLENKKDLIQLNNIEQTKKNLIWLSSHLVLFDHYLTGYEVYYSRGIVRRILKDVFKTEEMKNSKVKELGQMIAHTMAKNNRKQLLSLLKIYKDHEKDLLAAAANDKELLKLTSLISHNKSANDLLSGHATRVSNHGFIDGMIHFFNKVTDVLSGFFGNMAGAIRWREGHLFAHKPTEKDLEARFKPLDIILERTPFALTDTFIPGNFGHAAMWVGTPNQLKEIGMWDHPSIKPYQSEIEAGKYILEAIRPGVRLVSLEEFLQIDEIAILRNKEVLNGKQNVEQIFIRAMAQLGKDYDFNFDVTTTSSIVCSELIYHAMGEVNWPTKYIMGRATISPDNLAELVFYSGSPIEFFYYIEAKERHKVIKLSLDTFAQRQGFVLNNENSTSSEPVYDKKIRVCKDVYSNRIRVGSRRDNRLKRRVCLTKLKHYTYKAPREYRIDQ
ncbi:MAG: hypothetical protein EP326_12790 [Deltaproteobacteria bacterium]|nr:MAG: hypothetical protein EP326_12790 [Deltaproteobacteria bacterium]